MVTAVGNILELIRESFKEIGYQEELLPRHYNFADFLSSSYEVLNVELAAFAQQPPSYRSACFGVAVLPHDDELAVGRLRALGAPQIFTTTPAGGMIRRWKIMAEGNPQLAEELHPDKLRIKILDHRSIWGPDPMRRVKSLSAYNKPEQSDLFYDSGLLPVLEREVHARLDQLLGETIGAAAAGFKELHQRELGTDEWRGLFRMIFRFIAAKVLADRGHAGEWANPDPSATIKAVNEFYFESATSEVVHLNIGVQHIVWDRIRTGFRLQNLSMEALAYVYENTFVTRDTRRRFDTHATPYGISEYIVSQLPFEELAREERTVFEPFAGHAPFLTAALGRLRTLLPTDMDQEERHRYFVRMLRGVEIDAFAREVARYSLILADYPNGNDWRIHEADVFRSPHLSRYLAQARVVLCNPPYRDFSARERADGIPLASHNQAVEALRRVLDYPPRMLGFVLPRPVTDGQAYRGIRRQLAAQYDHISFVALPDTAFRYSRIDTAILLAHGRRSASPIWESALVRKPDYLDFVQSGRPSWDLKYQPLPDELTASDPPMWRAPLLDDLVEATRHLQCLGAVTAMHRGIRYTDDPEQHVLSHLPTDPQAAGRYRHGLHLIKGRLVPYAIGQVDYLDIRPELMYNKAYKRDWTRPKVVANAARVSRGEWTLAAAVDREGIYCTQNFVGIWTADETPRELIAAVLNGPLANAWINLQRGSQRHNTIGRLQSIPIPLLTPAQQQRVINLVRRYEEALSATKDDLLPMWVSDEELAAAITEIDLLILDGYDLPEQLQQSLLMRFQDQDRPGAPWFRGYPPRLSANESLEHRFRELADIWRGATYELSSYSDIVEHPAYQHVVRTLGKNAIPFILKEIAAGQVNWVWALRAITGEDPTDPKQRTDLMQVARAWLEWGETRTGA